MGHRGKALEVIDYFKRRNLEISVPNEIFAYVMLCYEFLSRIASSVL